MDECAKYIDLISAGVDGELSAEELRELNAHLEVCPECRQYASLVKEASAALHDMREEAPESLVSDVMGKIEKKRSIKPARIATVAAAAAVVVIAVSAMPSLLFRAGSAAPKKANSTEACVTEACAEEAPAAAEPKAECEPEEECEAADGAFEYSLNGEESISADKMAPALPYSESFYAIGVCTDTRDTPKNEKFKAYDTENGTESERYVFIPAADFDALAGEYGWTVYTEGHNIDRTAETAILVIY